MLHGHGGLAGDSLPHLLTVGLRLMERAIWQHDCHRAQGKLCTGCVCFFKFIYLFLAVLNLRLLCLGFLQLWRVGLLFVVVHGLSCSRA